MTLPRLYGELAELWPVMSPPEDSIAEVAAILDVLDAHVEAARPGQRRAVLELGAGAGHTLFHLRDAFDGVAVDRSDAMLAHCRRLNPRVETHVADMRTVRLGRTFDAVLAHDSVDYMVGLNDVRAVCETAAAHLRPGGVFLAAPTYTAENFVDHESAHGASGDGPREVAYVSHVHRTDRHAATYELLMVILVRESGKLRIEHDSHACGLFPHETWRRILAESGFRASIHGWKDGPDPSIDAPMTLFVGVLS